MNTQLTKSGTTSPTNTVLTLCMMFFLFSTLSAQQAPQAIADSLQQILDDALPTDFTKSGAVMGIVVPGQWSWFGASGYAISGLTSGQSETVATPSAKFRVGSITKNMVASAVLKLEEQGALNINDAIDKYLRHSLIYDTLMPSDTIRIRHLLNHTSGLSNSADNTDCQTDVLTNPLGSHTLEEAAYCGGIQGEIFPAGFAWAYSNTNYSLLAMILEEITGIPYAQHLEQTLFTSLSLAETAIPTTNQIQGAHMGCYWDLYGNGTYTDLTVINPSTYTGWADVVSNTEDLINYYRNLLEGNILNANELDTMFTVDDASFDYGMGLDFYTVEGENYYGHYGEVANTSGMFFGDIQTTLAPNGYYIAYNFNTQGASMQTLIDDKVMELLKSNFNTTTSIQSMSTSTMNFYPNPTSDVVKITGISENGKLKLSDLDGRVIHTEQLSGGNNVSISLDHLESGIYLVEFTGSTSTVTEKLIVY